MITTLEDDLAAATAYHGHLCAGMVLGVRMARLACQRLGIADPRESRSLIAFVEMARCPADAVYAVAGLTVGKRCLKLMDYGRMAMTIADTSDGRAFRVEPTADGPHMPQGEDPVEYFAPYADEELFETTAVKVTIPPEDRPGPPVLRARCELCGAQVLDGREVASGGRTLCRPCAEGHAYYEPVETVS